MKYFIPFYYNNPAPKGLSYGSGPHPDDGNGFGYAVSDKTNKHLDETLIRQLIEKIKASTGHREVIPLNFILISDEEE